MINVSTQRCYRLAPRGGAGLACDEEGLALGAVVLAHTQVDARGVRRCVMRPPEEIGRILRASYGPLRDETVVRLHQGLGRAAALIEAGDLGRAGIQAVMLGFPDLTPEAAQKLAAIADLEKAGAAWETERRIPAKNTGGGQWTADGDGAGVPKAVIRPKKSVRASGHGASAGRKRHALKPSIPAHPSRQSRQPYPVTTAPPMRPIEASLVMPAPTTALTGFGLGEGIAVPPAVARLGAAGLLAVGATLLSRWDANNTREQIANAITRFKLDPQRPADVVAATAYVWSQYQLGFHTTAPFSGPKLGAASEAVMRFALVCPAAFLAATQDGDKKSFSLIIGAAEGGLADYDVASHARPAGVDPSLQTTSRAARKAIGLRLNDKTMQAHHLVPAHVWGRNEDIAALAQKAGWSPDAPSNLIALPSSPASQTAFALQTGVTLPVHNRNHDTYNNETITSVLIARGVFSRDLTPLQARAILEGVALYNRIRIITGQYGLILRVG